LRKLARFFTKIAKKYLPDAFVFAIILSILVFILGLFSTNAKGTSNSPLDMMVYWGKGFWAFIAFAMQMVMILITGSALATSKPVKKLLVSIASAAKTPGTAIIINTVVMIIGSWLNWGFGLIVSALLAKEMAKRIKGIHYPLLVAAAYSGFVVWHAGLSASIPLKIAGADAIMKKYAGGAVIPTSQTIFHWQTLLIAGVLLLTLPLINRLMMPKNKEEIIEVDPEIFKDDDIEEPLKNKKDMTPAEKIERAWILNMIIGVGGIGYAIYHFAKGGDFSLNIVNFMFLILGIILHGKPINYVRAVNEAAKTTGGIALQFPFYAGIMGMMIHSGLAVAIAKFFVNISNQTTYPLFTYLSAGIINMFVPSGGGQWGVQGPIVMNAAAQLNVPLGKAAMAIAWGDAWTNMIQPFWALPLLAVARLGIRDIMGYTTVILLYSGIVTGVLLLF
jgi:short-chain fatty acids transporter